MASCPLRRGPVSDLNELGVDINVVAAVRPVLDMREAEDMKELVSAPDMVDTAASCTDRGQHQHVGPGPLQVAWPRKNYRESIEIFLDHKKTAHITLD